ncbi:MAG: hypothetical protein A3F91_00555 [Flavobacteria bacterium RIFCSPLOWO2_12_FULL_35_11]|nr:MAG: hypothetical protein A3F91_00555 [Flavobacteria bacterium RIFCSPLOWO2_12_FULL_35_11]
MITKVTDILNQSLDNSIHTNIVLLHLERDSPLIRQLIDMTGFGVYRVIIPPQLSQYVGMGDMIIKDGWNEITVPLAHRLYHNLIVTDKYRVVKQFFGGYIWEPTNTNDDFLSMGMVYSINKPNIPIALFHKSIIVKSPNRINGVGQMNEFRLIGTDTQSRTLDRLSLIDQQSNDDITETLDQWQPVEGKEVILKIPKQPWFLDKINRLNTKSQILDTNNLLNTDDTRTEESNDSGSDDGVRSISDYLGIVLTIITIIIVIYHISRYLHHRFYVSTGSHD